MTSARPSGFTDEYVYTGLGYLAEIRDNATAQVLWTANTRDADGQLTLETLGNGVQTARSFDPLTGRVQSIEAGFQNAVADLTFAFDTLGNLTSRDDANMSIAENFTYDALNRLKTYQVNQETAKAVSYDLIGNILSKSDIGNYAYGPANAARAHTVVYQKAVAITCTPNLMRKS